MTKTCSCYTWWSKNTHVKYKIEIVLIGYLQGFTIKTCVLLADLL